ncbi:MAG: glutathione S-transferase family protein [Planctomycetota bacterium]
MTQLKLYTLPLSPFNTKVRLALKLKGLTYEEVKFSGFDDRDPVVEVSGQPLTPVLVDGDKAIYDSFGILRYLDANFPGPRLFSSNRETMQRIQEWERFGAELGGIISMVLTQAFNDKIDDQATAQAQALLDTVPQALEDALADSDYLMGDVITAADLTVVPFLRFPIWDADDVDFPLAKFVAERLTLSAKFSRVHAWVARVMELDREVVAN